MRRPRNRPAATVVAGLLIASLVGVAPATGRQAAATSTKKVKVVDFAFSPRTITIARGTRVRWTNSGNAPHTSTSNAGVWDSGKLTSGESFSRVFRKAGTFKYHCRFHPAMKAKVVVT